MFSMTLIIAAIATGMVYVLAAYGLVVTYRVTGVFNMALGYQAAFAAFLYWQCSQVWHWSVVLSAILVVFISGPVVGLVVQQVLFRKRREVLSAIILTLGFGVFINGIIDLIWNAGSGSADQVNSVFGNGFFHFAGTVVTYDEVGVIASSAVMGVLVYLLFTRGRLGLRMRAVVDDPELA